MDFEACGQNAGLDESGLMDMINIKASGQRIPMNVHFDVSPDDRRFLFLKRPRHDDEETSGSTVLVQNWLTDVRERMKGTR